MNKKPVETIMGIVVLFVAAVFLYFAFKVSDLQVVKGYNVNANFLKVGGLNVGSDVRINGIKVGSIVELSLDNQDYIADVKMSILPNIKLPKDSVVAIVGDGLMGDKFIKIEPGKSKEMLADGDTLSNVKDFKSLEDIFSITINRENQRYPVTVTCIELISLLSFGYKPTLLPDGSICLRRTLPRGDIDSFDTYEKCLDSQMNGVDGKVSEEKCWQFLKNRLQELF